MYHHHSQQQGPQPFSNGPRLPHHQPPPNQHQNRSSTDMSSQGIGFQFPRPTQLPDELESALSIRGDRDMDHRLIDHMNQPNQHQNQGSGAGISQHGNYSANPVTLTSDNQPAHQQGVDWSSYQPPTKLFASVSPSASHQSQRHQGPQSSLAGANTPSWTATVSDSPSPLARHMLGSAGGGVDGQSLYTPESAGSILASFGLSNEDLEVLSHYPDDQLTPDTLPFILRDIQINKSGNQKTVASSSSSSFSRNIHDIPLPTSHSSPLARGTVTQTAGKVIDYGHTSRANDESSARETFKREPLSSERTVKMYPSSSSVTKVDKTERRQVHLEHTEPSKHGDQDYRRTSSDHRKSSRSPGRVFPSKARNLDRDYRRDRPKPRPSSETRSEDSSIQSPSSSSDSKPISSSKKIPTPTMISDFSAVSPKVYPHTCSLCHTQCDQEKDWVEHINTVSHTAACRDLRNKYPAWKPNLPSRRERYSSQALWDPRDGSPSYSISRSLSCSPPSSPPHSKHREVLHRPHGRPFSPHRHPRHHRYTEHRAEYRYSGLHSPSHLHQTTSSHIRDHRSEKRDRESSGSSSRSGVKRPYDGTAKYSTETNQHPSSSKHGPSQSNTRAVKSGTKPGPKSAKSPPAKKKKKMVTQLSQDWSVANRLVYLTGIPNDASEQEVTELVGSFGKINNVILMPCSEEEGEKNEGQKASVCMVKAEDAKALANSTHLSIRDQHITTSVAKKPEGEHPSDANYSKRAPGQDKHGAGEDSGCEADQKSEEKGLVLITGLPESGCSESDIITLVEPFGTPSDIIMAAQIGKVLVSVPDIETAQEMVKVHTFTPAKIKGSEVKMIHLRQHIGLSTPVALYNLLVGSVDPLESPAPVTWSSLLVISNVPNMPSASSEVQKLVQRFGTVIKTLVLNNMVICEMATAAMALSVYKRFHTFPCIIQNNPLFFSRKPDPKAQAKVIAAYADSSEDAPTNGRGSQIAAATKDETVHEEKSECHLEEMEKDADGKNEKMKSTERLADEDKTLAENGNNDIVNKDSDDVSSITKPEADVDPNIKPPVKTGDVLETSEEDKEVSESEAGNDKIPAAEETNPCSSEGKAVVSEQVTSEMVNALIVECRTRIGSQPSNTAASACREQQETQMETEQNKESVQQTKAQDKSHTEEEVKRQEREKKERQARKEKETKEKREKERRAWEKEERARRERERDERVRREREKREEERREWERRERERRERKRAYGEGFPGSRSSFSSQGYKQSSWRDEDYNSSKAETKVGEEDDDDFPFNMRDFVTVDEVGDVNELPCSPPHAVSMETTEGGEDTPTSVPPHTAGDTHMEVTTETMSDTTESQVKHSEHEPLSEPVTSDSLQPCSSQTHEPACQAEAAETETESTLVASLDSTTDIEYPHVNAPAVSSNPPEATADSNNPGAAVVIADSKKDEKGQDTHSQAEEEEVVSDKAEEQEKTQDEEAKAPAAETGKHEGSEDQTNARNKREKELKTETAVSTDYFLPFDPSRPVGMEFLVPKTGFFCKVCNRFFSGNKEAEINHCKTVKHYDNLQKYLQTTKT